MDKKLFEKDHRISTAKKEANDFQWYKDKVNLLDTHGARGNYSSQTKDKKKMKRNYDLFNNILDKAEMKYVVNRFKDGDKGMNSKLENRDALSSKVKAIMGLEMSRPFDYKILALNKEASVRKTEEFNDRIKSFVINGITAPIREKAQLEAEAQFAGKPLTPEDEEQIRQMVQQAMETQTPDKVKEYMEKDHQDIAEIMHHRLFEFVTQKTDLKHIFNKGVKDAALVAREYYWVGEAYKKVHVEKLDPMRFEHDRSPDVEFVEYGDWASYEWRMTPGQVISFFGGELTEKEIDQIYSSCSGEDPGTGTIEDRLFSLDGTIINIDESENWENTIRVFHGVWKSLRELFFLTYYDEELDDIVRIQVDENYEFNPEIGDLEIESEWVMECYETYKIGSDIYKRMRPVPGQFRDPNTIYECKLPYYGVVYDGDNSEPTSIFDRGVNLQYYLNAVYYRFENLLATDKGKKVFMSLAAAGGDGMDLEEFQHYFESTPFGWLDSSEEGIEFQDINSMVKVVDLSVASDMRTYIELIQMLKSEIGEAMGVSRQMEAQIAQRDAVRNTQQALVQNSYILEPFYSLHDKVKRNVSLAAIEQAKITYKDNTEPLVYVLDDMSQAILELDQELLESTTIGLFIADNGKTNEIKQTITDLAHAAVQSQTAKLSDIITIMNETSVTVAADKLKAKEKEAEDRLNAIEENRNQAIQKAEEMKIQAQREKHEQEVELLNLEYDRKEKLEVIKGALVGMSYNPDKDGDQDGENDFFEIAKEGLDAEIKLRKDQREEAKLELDKQKEINKRLKDDRDYELKKKALDQKSTPSSSN